MIIRLLLLLLLGACASIGSHNSAKLSLMQKENKFGEWQEVKLCAALDEGVTEEYAKGLLDSAWNREEASLYKLKFSIAKSFYKKRESFTYQGIVKDLLKMPLAPECDRVFWFVGRDVRDVAYGLVSLLVPMPEYLGAVSFVHGFSVVKFASPAQLVSPINSTLKHELYHMLGCEHDAMSECYSRIAALKKGNKSGIFPAILYPDKEEAARNYGAPYLVSDRETIIRYTLLPSLPNGSPSIAEGVQYSVDQLADILRSKTGQYGDNITSIQYLYNEGNSPQNFIGAIVFKSGDNVEYVRYLYEGGRVVQFYNSINRTNND